MSRISFAKCYFCQKSFNKLALSEINSNTAFINDESEEISFNDLIFDVCGVKIDENKLNYACFNCNDRLMSFHFFKRDVKRYSSFRSHIEKLEILSKVEAFLDNSEAAFCFNIAEDHDRITISIKGDDPVLQFEGEECDEDIFGDDELFLVDPSAIEPENSAVFPSPHNFAIETSDPGQFLIVDDQKFDVSTGEKRNIEETESPIRLKVNKQQASSLSSQKKNFKCTVCDCSLANQSSLNRHIRESHKLKNDTTETAALKDEVTNSKVVIETANGTELNWQCQQCEGDRIFKNEQAFKLHFRMTHIRTSKIDRSFIAACKISVEEESGSRTCWKCPDCDRIFRHRDSLRHHIKLVHKNKEDDQEENLAKKTTDGEALSRIAKKLECKELGKSLNFCHECGLKFSTTRVRYKPRVHKECHEIFQQLAPHMPSYRCEACRKIFCSDSALHQHEEVHDDPSHEETVPSEGLAHFGAAFFKTPSGDADEVVDAVDEAVWKCGHCPAQYFDRNNCISHVMLLHTAPIFCFIDNREFNGTTGLSKYLQHMKNKHPELFPNLKYPCNGCELEFTSVYDKLAHQKGCEAKKFQCDYCGKRFSTKLQLQSHILYELGLSGYLCSICDKRCKTSSDLKIHKNVHTNARPYECSLCPKTFKTPAARSTHVETHTTEGISCEVGGQKLSSRTLYQRHKRYQHNQTFRLSQLKNNVCKLCERTFLRTSHYRQHMKKIHDVVIM